MPHILCIVKIGWVQQLFFCIFQKWDSFLHVIVIFVQMDWLIQYRPLHIRFIFTLDLVFIILLFLPLGHCFFLNSLWLLYLDCWIGNAFIATSMNNLFSWFSFGNYFFCDATFFTIFNFSRFRRLMASQYSLVVSHDLPLNTLSHLNFLDSLSKQFKSLFFVNVQTLNLVYITILELLIDSGMIFGSCHDQNRVNFELLLFHFLMMASTLMCISCFDEYCHQVKDVIEPSFGSDLESLFKMFNKDRIFKFLLLRPMAFSLIRI